MEPMSNIPVYRQDGTYARAQGAIELFRASYQANMACKADIEKAIRENFDGMHLPKTVVIPVLDQYGSERVEMVLAATVQYLDWDGRFSRSNKEWAASIPMFDQSTRQGIDLKGAFAVGSHPAVLNGFIDFARKEMMARERISVKDALHQPAAVKAKTVTDRQPCKKDLMER